MLDIVNQRIIKKSIFLKKSGYKKYNLFEKYLSLHRF